MKRTTIEIRDLSIGYRTHRKTRQVGSGLDASIRSGELTCLLGANGVGKSTLLRTLTAFQPPLAGEVRIFDRPVGQYRTAELARLLGVVLTEKCDLHNMTVEELVGMGRSPYTGFWGGLGREDLRLIDEAIDRVGIASLRGRMVHTLSDGERQKVMIAKALAQQTPVILLDEPTAFLDYPSKVEIMQLLLRLTREADRTIFLSTHDLELALQIADRIWLMEGERGVTVGTPEDLSLDGSMERFFSRRGIRFDRRIGLFRVVRPSVRSIAVAGSGERREMTCKALRRTGIDPVAADGEKRPLVEITDEAYLLHEACGSTRCATIGELLEKLE
ncbi:MAG: ABC transporter ATP-binding protein [Alistipes sp.]|nr:ABC transporter ATP-binding protein [Alistipes sp.]